MRGHLEPLSADPSTARRLGLRAVTARTGDGHESSAWAAAYRDRLDAGTLNGRLYVVAGVVTGFVSWLPGGPVGISIDLLFASDGGSDPGTYARILAAVEEQAGPVAFVPGPLAGVPAGAEEPLMRSLGFRRYGRSEMELERAVTLPVEAPSPGEVVRRIERTDLFALADLHRGAYHDSFDRFLFLELTDDKQDAVREVREILDGRWGEFAPAGSWLLEERGHLAGAVLTVHGTAGALIADVMVAPEARGRGVGRRVLTAAVRGMLDAGATRVYLNVTEGNERAIRLYRRLGFVRSLGPTHDWYNARRIPVAPAPDA